MLDDDLSAYRDNQLATNFLNWNLSRGVLAKPDYYENVILIYENFKNDPPRIVIDKHDIMPALLDRIPELKDEYVNTGQGVYKHR
jgi:hypothetical protein